MREHALEERGQRCHFERLPELFELTDLRGFRRSAKATAITGLVTGLVIALALAFGPFDFIVAGNVWGLQPGLYGLAANATIALVGSALKFRG